MLVMIYLPRPVTDGSAGKFHPVAKRAIAMSHAHLITISSTVRNDRDITIRVAMDRAIGNAIGIANAMDRAIDRDIAIGNVINSAIGRDISSSIDSAIGSGISIGIGIVRAIDIGRGSRDIGSGSGIDIAMDIAIGKIKVLDSENIFKDVSFDELLAKLEALKNQTSIDEDVKAILQAWSNALNLTPEMIDLSDKEWYALQDYLDANYLLIQCKDAAARVSPSVWEGIEARMLTVPQ